MSDAYWVLLDPQGNVIGQSVTDGRSPAEDGSNPGGLAELRVERHGDLSTEQLINGAWQPRLDALRALRMIDAKAFRGVLAANALVASMDWPPGNTIEEYLGACRTAWASVRDTIDAAATADDIAAVDITAGYPAA